MVKQIEHGKYTTETVDRQAYIDQFLEELQKRTMEEPCRLPDPASAASALAYSVAFAEHLHGAAETVGEAMSMEQLPHPAELAQMVRIVKSREQSFIANWMLRFLSSIEGGEQVTPDNAPDPEAVARVWQSVQHTASSDLH